mmetsp:Transcript_9853/g.32262  ORF Transcript_9853/g.32262 Transcript_9853/m.32262 type:complete len:153 (+) Transcript_9853:147-605(+)
MTRPSTSRGSEDAGTTPKEIAEHFARKKSAPSTPALDSIKESVSKTEAQKAAKAAEKEALEKKKAAKMLKDKEERKQIARLVSSQRAINGNFFTGVSCTSGQNIGVFHKPLAERDASVMLTLPSAASHFMPLVGGEFMTGEGAVVADFPNDR